MIAAMIHLLTTVIRCLTQKPDAISHLLGFSESGADRVSGWWVHSQQYFLCTHGSVSAQPPPSYLMQLVEPCAYRFLLLSTAVTLANLALSNCKAQFLETA